MKNQRVKGTLNEKPAGEGHPINTKSPAQGGASEITLFV